MIVQTHDNDDHITTANDFIFVQGDNDDSEPAVICKLMRTVDEQTRIQTQLVVCLRAND